MNSKVIAAIVVIAALVIGGIFYLQNKSSDNASTTASPSASATPAQSPTPSSSASASSSPVATATVIYGDSGFAVATTTVKSGASVTFTNNSSSTIQLDSDPHPAHTDNVELNVGTIAPGTSKTIVVSKVGNWGMHNHLNPTMTTRIVVQ